MRAKLGRTATDGSHQQTGVSLFAQLLVEAAQSDTRHDESLHKPYQRRCHSKPKGVAKVAAARTLAVQLYWMPRP